MLKPREFPDTRPSLLGALRGEDVERWREFFDQYAPAVYRVARLRGLATPDAEDVVQQVMLAVSQHIGGFQYDRDRGKFRQWVRRIAENRIIDLHRKRRATLDAGQFEPVDEEPTPDEVWEREWRWQDVLYCLDEVAKDLSLRRIEAFRLYVIEGLPAAEVAARLDMTVGHVYVTRTQVLNRIRERMSALDGAEDGRDG
jgi:RNA polymerase sigma factor (sigma-70 family)